jgi:uncharacterized protein YjbJ (UPF0337 family)
MNWDTIQGKWKQLKGGARQRWAKLTDDDWDMAAGKRDSLLGRLQERYGWSRDEAEREMSDWEHSTGEGDRTMTGR